MQNFLGEDDLLKKYCGTAKNRSHDSRDAERTAKMFDELLRVFLNFLKVELVISI
jgi:hypothetical protein